VILTVEPGFQNVRVDTAAPALTARVTITRTGPSGTPAAVRGWLDAPAASGAVIARDYEAPIGVPLTYTLVAVNAAGAELARETGTITIPSGGCEDTWLNDLARVGNTLRVVLETIPELAYPVPATPHEVITRRAPIVSSDIAHTPELEVSILTASDDERYRARALLGNGVPVLLRTPPAVGVGNMYLAVLGFHEQRLVSPGTVPDRRFVISARQVERPAPALYNPQPPVTYADVRAEFATYALLKAGRVTYDALLYDWAGSEPSDIVPWPPVDV
jgi:hypothetical protein